MGKDGSSWKHGYIPENAIAVAMKNHLKGGSSGGKSAAPKKPAKPAHDLTTREGRQKALEGVDISTPAGRALVSRVQRASIMNAPVSYAPGTDPVAARAALAKAAASRKARKKTVKRKGR